MFCACVRLLVHIPFSSWGLHYIQPDTFQAGRVRHKPKYPSPFQQSISLLATLQNQQRGNVLWGLKVLCPRGVLPGCWCCC